MGRMAGFTWIYFLVVALICSNRLGQAAEPSQSKDKAVIHWITLDTSETAETIVTSGGLPIRDLATRADFENWLRRRGELKAAEIPQTPRNPTMIPTNAFVSPFEYETKTHRIHEIDPEQILKRMDANPDKDCSMYPADETYRDLLGQDWLSLPHTTRIDLIKRRANEVWDHYRSCLGIRWFCIGDVVVGITLYNHWDRYDENPLDSRELIAALAFSETPEE